jgi:hypothetical protein
MMKDVERIERLERLLAQLLALLVESNVCAGPGGEGVQVELRSMQQELFAVKDVRGSDIC